MTTRPIVSAIITTYNSAGTLERLLISLKQQTYKNLEIVVVDNNSKDETVQIAKKYTKLVFNKGPERSDQRNFGVEKSHGSYLLILDSDMEMTPKVVGECVELFESKDPSLGGIIIPEQSVGNGFWTQAKIFEREINRGYDYFEAARFYPKTIFNKYKGYDTELIGPEDWDLPRRVAKDYRIVRISSLILHHEGNLSLKKLYQKKYYYGLSVHKFLKKQQLSPISPSTIYFLRPAFYHNWFRLITHPITTLAMIVMLTVETAGGGLGYLVGRYKNDR